jgi:hypothetical protein
MPGSQDLSLTPVAGIGAAAPAHPVAAESPLPQLPTREAQSPKQDAAASTGGNLSPAVAQFVINPDTHDVVIRVTDPGSGQVLMEYPSQQVEAIAKYMKQYADTAARHRASRSASSVN